MMTYTVSCGSGAGVGLNSADHIDSNNSKRQKINKSFKLYLYGTLQQPELYSSGNWQWSGTLHF